MEVAFMAGNIITATNAYLFRAIKKGVYKMPVSHCKFIIEFDFDFREGEFDCQHEILDFIKDESKNAIEVFTDDIGIAKCKMTCEVGDIVKGGRFDRS